MQKPASMDWRNDSWCLEPWIKSISARTRPRTDGGEHRSAVKLARQRLVHFVVEQISHDWAVLAKQMVAQIRHDIQDHPQQVGREDEKEQDRAENKKDHISVDCVIDQA